MSGSKRTLVTGGAGFIGSHLVDRLVKHGHTVTVLDDMTNGKLANLKASLQTGNVVLNQVDIANLNEIKPLFEGIDWVFHLAAKADVVPSIQHPIDYHRSNVDGTIAVLEAARIAKVSRFVYAASSSCYGLADEFPTKETFPASPMHPYALTKFVGEQYVLHWDQVYGLPTLCLRLFNVYGPRARTSGSYGAVFGVFLAQKLAGKPFTIVGDGTQTRDFTFVSDVTDAFMKAAESNLYGEVMNVGSGNTYSINRLVELLDGNVVYLPKRPGEPDCTYADITKIKNLLGWSPVVNFELGVKTMIDQITLWENSPVWDKNSINTATRDWFEYMGEKNPETS